jgi:DNA-binding response OmpR family regulator
LTPNVIGITLGLTEKGFLMATTSNSVKVIRFGVFELDLSAGELRKSGLRIKLQEQPFQVLAALLERPGELVGKEELRKRLWPDGHLCGLRSWLGQRH